MKLPRSGGDAERVLLALWRNKGPMSIADLMVAARVNVENLMNIADCYELRTAHTGVYELRQQYVGHFNNCMIDDAPAEPLQIAQPREFNFRTPELKGYEASMRRAMRAA